MDVFDGIDVDMMFVLLALLLVSYCSCVVINECGFASLVNVDNVVLSDSNGADVFNKELRVGVAHILI
jgi:hypothetical protein